MDCNIKWHCILQQIVLSKWIFHYICHVIFSISNIWAGKSVLNTYTRHCKQYTIVRCLQLFHTTFSNFFHRSKIHLLVKYALSALTVVLITPRSWVRPSHGPKIFQFSCLLILVFPIRSVNCHDPFYFLTKWTIFWMTQIHFVHCTVRSYRRIWLHTTSFPFPVCKGNRKRVQVRWLETLEEQEERHTSFGHT